MEGEIPRDLAPGGARSRGGGEIPGTPGPKPSRRPETNRSRPRLQFLVFRSDGDCLQDIFNPRMSFHPGTWGRDEIIQGRAHPAPKPFKQR